MISQTGTTTGTAKQLWAFGTGTPPLGLLTVQQVQIFNTSAAAMTLQVGPTGGAVPIAAGGSLKLDAYHGQIDMSQLYINGPNADTYAWIAT